MQRLTKIILTGGMTLGVLAISACKEEGKKEMPTPEVTVAEVAVEDVPVYREWVGGISGAQNAQIEARVSGYLLARDYTEGSVVQAGQTLFQIDPRPYQAALAEAQAQLSQAQAKAELARITLERQTELFKTQVISAQEFDVSTQTAQADIAAVQAAEANVETAQLNLEFCTIIAPFEGIAGKAEAQVGDLVGPGAGSLLTTVSQIQPIKVNFYLSEQEYLMAKSRLHQVEAIPVENRPRDFQIYLANGDLYPQSGIFDFLNRQVDPRTGTIEVVSLFPNPHNVLRPGQYAKVKVLVETLKNAIVVPQRAVTEMQGTYFQVAVVGKDNTVEIRTVTPGVRHGSDWVITKGLSAGETIVIEGGQKLSNGIKVQTKPYTPTPTPTPSPTATPAPIPAVEPAVSPPPVPGSSQAQEQAMASPSPTPMEQGASSPTPTPDSQAKGTN